MQYEVEVEADPTLKAAVAEMKAAGLDPATILMLVQLAMELFKAWRQRRESK